MKTDKAKNIKTRFFAILLSLVLLIGLVPGTGMKVFATDAHTETVTETSDVTNLENEGSDTVDVNGPVTVEEDGKRINDESTTGITERLATDSEASLETSEERIEKPKAGSHDEANIGGVAKAAPERQELSVGGVKISSTGYWITDDDGSVIAYSGEGTPTDNYIYYDKDTNTLTLHNITIKKANHNSFSSSLLSTLSKSTGIGVYNHKGDAELTIRLEGDNKIENLSMPVNMYTNQDSATASLTIEGDGSLHTEGYGNGGINVISIYGNTNLSINNAKVTANTKVGLSGVAMRSGKGEGINSSLTVSGGSLTASCANMLSAGHEFHGIGFNFGSSFKGLGTPTITISNNGVIAAGNDGIVSNGSSVQFETGNDGSGGIVFDGKQGTVYGNVTLPEDLEIDEWENLTISEGARLTIPEGKTITVKDGGSLNVETGATLNNEGKISVQKGGELNGDVGGTGELAYDREAEVDDKRYSLVSINGQRLMESGYYQNNNGVWEKSDDNNIPDDHYIHYDRQKHVLTLNNVTITSHGTAIFVDDTARNMQKAKEEVYLHIILKGTNTVLGGMAIEMTSRVYRTHYDRVKLKISGPGTLTVRGIYGGYAGIMLQNPYGDSELIVDGADVAVEGYNHCANFVIEGHPCLKGVYIQYSKTGTGKLTVKGGKLISSGIELFGGTGMESQGKDRIVVTDAAVVKVDGEENLYFNKDDFSVEIGDNGTGGIIFDGKQGRVYGNVILPEDWEIDEGENLTISEGARLTIPEGKTITVKDGGSLNVETGATLDNEGKIVVKKGGVLNGETSGSGTVEYVPAVSNGGTITVDSDESEIRKVFGNADISVSDKVISLYSNLNVNDSIIFKNGDWTLELGDSVLAGNAGVTPLKVEGGNLTIRGNKGMVRGGDVIESNASGMLNSKGIYVNGGNLTVAGGTVSGGHASGNEIVNSIGISVDRGSVIVTGGTVQGGKLSAIGNRNIRYGYGESVGIYASRSTIIVTGGIVTADSGDHDNGKTFISKSIKSEGETTIAVLGGKIIPKHGGYAVGISCWKDQNHQLIVTGGTVNENIENIETAIITGGMVDSYSASRNIGHALWLPDKDSDKDLIMPYDNFKGRVILPNLTKVRELLKTVGIDDFNPYIINKDKKITISADESLIIPEGELLINYGTITVEEGGRLENNGQIHNRGEIKGKIEGKQLPQVDNEKLTDATVGKEYSAQLDKNNDSIKWSLKEDSQLPKGLTLDGDTGVISGKPTETGDFTFTLLAENAGGSEFKNFNIRVNPAIKEEDKPVNYVVTMQTEGNGKTSSNPMIANQGTKVILNATPDAGYVFKGWEVVSGSAKIEDNSFIMPAENVVIKAIFEKEKTAPNKQPNTKVLDKQSNTKVLPKTGEESNIGLWFALMMASLAYFVVLVVSRRKKN